MREIKFRAWDERRKIMHYDFEFIMSGIENNDWIVFKSDKNRLDSKPHPFDNPRFQKQLKIMQFTGLEDKNGKDIYEGDILHMKQSEHLGYTPHLVEHICELYDRDSYTYHFSEVIGNIYENPELLIDQSPTVNNNL